MITKATISPMAIESQSDKSKLFTALVPMRSGSKRIPDKNVRILDGKPLFYWSLSAAVSSDVFKQIYISTDSTYYRHLVSQFFPQVKFFERSQSSCLDTAATEELLLEFLEQVDFQNLVTIQVTSPMTTDESFINACNHYLKSNADSLYTGVHLKRFIWDEHGPLNYDPLKRPRSQDFKGFVMENGAFYITRREILEKRRSRLGGKIEAYLMNESSFLEIDTEDDWILLEAIFKTREKKRKSSSLT